MYVYSFLSQCIGDACSNNFHGGNGSSDEDCDENDEIDYG